MSLTQVEGLSGAPTPDRLHIPLLPSTKSVVLDLDSQMNCQETVVRASQATSRQTAFLGTRDTEGPIPGPPNLSL